MLTADEKVERLIIRFAREGADNLHLRTCPDLTVKHPEAYDGEYGCDTGCSYVTLEATLSCPHGATEAFTWGDFGELDWLLEEMDIE